MSPSNRKPSEPNWKSMPMFGRRDGLLYTTHRSFQLCDKPPIIVEIGTSRDERPEACEGDGWSTRALGWLAKETGGKAYTVDNDPEAIEACKRITAEQVDGIEYIVSDSVEFLQNWNDEERGLIDLLYLDGLDYFDTEKSESYQQMEAKAALPHLAAKCLVLFDDTYPDHEIHAISHKDTKPREAEIDSHENAQKSQNDAEIQEPLEQKPRNIENQNQECALTQEARNQGTKEEDRTLNARFPPNAEYRKPDAAHGPSEHLKPNTEHPYFSGKGTSAVPYLLQNGFSVEFVSGGQVLLSRGAEEIPANFVSDRFSTLVTHRLQEYARRRWLEMPALVTIGHYYREFEASAEAQVYLEAVARLCRGMGGQLDGETGRIGEAIEIGPTSACSQAFLARRGVCASGILLDGDHIERARQSAHWLGCRAEYGVGGLFTLNGDTVVSCKNAKTPKEEETHSHKNAQKSQKNSDSRTPDTDALLPNTEHRTPNTVSVIHHSNLASALPTPWLLAMLAQQVAMANWVVFSVDSVFAEQNGELDEIGCRRLTPEMWQELLRDFEIGDLRTYGPTGKERVLVTLRGAFEDQGPRAEDQAKPSLTLGDLNVGTDTSAEPPLLTSPTRGEEHVGSEAIRSTMAPDYNRPSNAFSVQTPKTEHPMPTLDPFPFGVSLIIHTRNEAHQIIDCIRSADGLADEIIICDMESDDGTLDQVAQYAANLSSLPVAPSPSPPVKLIRHPLIPNFDSARNSSYMFARYRFVFYLDSDERLPVGLAAHLRHLLATQGHMFEAMALPFRNMFCGKELNCIYGYKAASIYKNGYFFYNARPHQGARIDGRVVNFPADNPNLALLHLTYPNLPEYIRKMDGYSSTEAANMKIDQLEFHWQQMLAHAVQDMVGYDLRGALRNDGPHGLLWTLCSGFYRIAQYGKHWQARYESGTATVQEAAVPGSLEEVLEFMLAVTRQFKSHAEMQHRNQEQISHKNAQKSQKNTDEQIPNSDALLPNTQHLTPVVVSHSPSPPLSHSGGLPVTPSPRLPVVVWQGPANDPSGYGEEVRSFLFACDRVGIDVALRAVSWGNDQLILSGEKADRMQQLLNRPVAPGYIQIIQNFPEGFVRDPNASIVIGRTMFEVDRIPVEHVQMCNEMDYIWVPSEWAVDVYRKSGVAAEKLVVMPGCFDSAEFVNHDEPQNLSHEKAQKAQKFVSRKNAKTQENAPDSMSREATKMRRKGTLTFLTMFDWTLHKGWDVLLTAFLKAFDTRGDGSLRPAGYDLRPSNVRLVIKTWSTHGYSNEQIIDQASNHVKRALGVDPRADSRIQFFFERLSRKELIDLYYSADVFLLPSRGEGWGRPMMEAQAAGLIVVGTNWSGNTEFMNNENSFLLDYKLVPVPEVGWREIPTYKGAMWAEPDGEQLVEILKQVGEARSRVGDGESGRVGEMAARGQAEVCAKYSLEAVGELIKTKLERLVSEKTGFSPTPDLSLSPSINLPVLHWVGPHRTRHSIGFTNREFCLGLIRAALVELCIIPTEPQDMAVTEDPRFALLERYLYARTSRLADITVCHGFPPCFDPPRDGKLVLVQPWEFGFLPLAWLDAIAENVDEVWCYSNYVRDVYVASGVPESILHVIPLGVDADLFNPQAPPYIFTTEHGVAHARKKLDNDPFIFLFVGGSLHRKGIDIVIDAFNLAFTSLDNVILVIKDYCVDTVYRVGNNRDRLIALANDPTRAAIIYMDQNLTPHRHAGLYTAAHVLLGPSRGEGFYLPGVEALSSGCAIMTPLGGPTDDYSDESTGYPLQAVRVEYPTNRIGEWECAGRPWMLEVSPEHLAMRMREAAANREEAKRRGMAGAERMRASWTWDHAATKMLERIKILSHKKTQKAQNTSMQKITKEENQKLTQETRNEGSKDNRIVPGQFPPNTENRKPNTISVCMIVKNEERVLEACLKTLVGWAYEIILVDTGSTDRTVEIAIKYGCKVYFFEWCDDFSAARNESLKHIDPDSAWAFWCDGDDEVPVVSAEAIVRAAETAPENVIGFVIPVQFVEDSGEASGTRVDHVKLFRNKPGLKFTGRIHEQILPSLRAAGGEIARCNAVVLHSGYDTSPDGQARKHARDERILALELAERPDDSFANFNRGMTDHYGTKHEEAIVWLRKCLTLAHPSDSIVRKAYVLLAISLRELGRTKDYEEAIETGLSYYPDDPELNFNMAQARTAQGRFADAKRHYLTCLNADTSTYFSSFDTAILGVKTFHNLGAVCLMDQDYPGAREWWLKAIESNPKFDVSRLTLFNAAIEANDHLTAHRMLVLYQNALQEGVELWWITARYAEAIGDTVTAERNLRRILQADANALPPKMALAKLLLNSDRIAEAEPHLATLCDSGVAEAAFYLGVNNIRTGDLQTALRWMEKAQSLNPQHQETREQVENLRRAVGG